MLSEEEINAKLDRYHHGLIKIVYETYASKGLKAQFVYQDDGEVFWARAENVWNGQGSALRKARKLSARRRMTIERVKADITIHHGDIVTIDENSYVCSSQKATFIDREHGPWITIVGSVRQGMGHPKRIVEKRKRTMRERFGVEYPLQNEELYQRAKRSRWNTQRIQHWRTQEYIECTASYEIAFVEWCNTNQIDFDWQILHKMPDGRVYIIDAFIKTGKFANTWIEIKGWLTGSTKEKWEWFHSLHPEDSQLWNKSRLKQVGVLKTPVSNRGVVKCP